MQKSGLAGKDHVKSPEVIMRDLAMFQDADIWVGIWLWTALVCPVIADCGAKDYRVLEKNAALRAFQQVENEKCSSAPGWASDKVCP